MELSDLQETADLARLPLSEKELQEVFPAFVQMLSLFNEMQAADKDKDPGPGQFASGNNEAAVPGARYVSSEFFRLDTENPKSDGDPAENMLVNAGERDGRFIVIPNVL